MSALGDIVAVKEAVEMGECMYLEKPPDKDKVLLNIKQALGLDGKAGENGWPRTRQLARSGKNCDVIAFRTKQT